MKRLLLLIAIALVAAPLVFGGPTLAAVPLGSDVIFVVDESGSMSGEHAWIASMVTSLEAGLVGAGVTNNQYALVGFGGLDVSGQVPHKHLVGGGDFGTAGQLSTAAAGLVASGGTEDGWNGIDYALGNYTLRGSDYVTNVILITDEDRDNQNGALSYAGILASLGAENALLNVVVNFGFEDGIGTTALGVDSAGNAYLANGSGGFTMSAGGVATTGWGTTKTDYIDLAWATSGAAWDLNQLRLGGLTADSFTAAFVDIKVHEVVTHPTPEPASLLLLGAGILGMAVARRRLRK